jgi:hypothetical protein
LAAFLRTELKLELSTEKTLITHARTRKARFLGYDIWTRQADTWHTKGGRSINGNIALGVPPEAVNTRCRTYQRKQGKPLIRNDLIRTSDHNIVATYGSEYRGYVQYYQMAGNINWLNKLRYVMERSMLSTLAAKHRRPPWAMRRRTRQLSRPRTGNDVASKRPSAHPRARCSPPGSAASHCAAPSTPASSTARSRHGEDANSSPG